MELDAASPPTMQTSVAGLLQRELHGQRFSALAAAVREHEAGGRSQLLGVRPHDLELYRRLRQICGGL